MSEPSLDGRHAVVTGGGRGIGAAIARALAGAGARVTILGRDAPALEHTAAALRGEHGADVLALRADLTVSDDIDSALRVACNRFGDPWILVNNAGQADGARFTDTSRALWDRMLAINATAAFECTRRVLPAMIDAGGGRIVNIASIAGLRGVAHVAAYTASKHALVGMTRALALEVAKHGITANALCPAYVDTDMAERALDALVAAGRTRDEALHMITRQSSIGRLVRPEEVAAAALWLCSAEAQAVTGQTIVLGAA